MCCKAKTFSLSVRSHPGISQTIFHISYIPNASHLISTFSFVLFLTIGQFSKATFLLPHLLWHGSCTALSPKQWASMTLRAKCRHGLNLLRFFISSSYFFSSSNFFFFFFTILSLFIFPLDLAVISEGSRTMIMLSWFYHYRGHLLIFCLQKSLQVICLPVFHRSMGKENIRTQLPCCGWATLALRIKRD